MELEVVVIDANFCYICFEFVGKELFTLRNCGHSFCHPCLYRFIESKIRERNTAPKCFYPTIDDLENARPNFCGSTISEDDILKIFDIQNPADDSVQQIKARYVRFKFMNDHAENARECPHNDCGALQLGAAEAPDMICIRCAKPFCFFHTNAHLNSSCDEYATVMTIENTANENFISATTKPCPTCKRPIAKSGGCNHMRCVCGAAFCWLCGQEVDDAVYPRHFMWWNLSNCANLQMSDEVVPSLMTRIRARSLSILQFLIIGPLSVASSLLSFLLCPCVSLCMLRQEIPLPERLWDLFTHCISGWGMVYIFLLFILPMSLCLVGILLVLLLIIYPFYAIWRLIRKEAPCPDIVLDILLVAYYRMRVMLTRERRTTPGSPGVTLSGFRDEYLYYAPGIPGADADAEVSPGRDHDHEGVEVAQDVSLAGDVGVDVRVHGAPIVASSSDHEGIASRPTFATATTRVSVEYSAADSWADEMERGERNEKAGAAGNRGPPRNSDSPSTEHSTESLDDFSPMESEFDELASKRLGVRLSRGHQRLSALVASDFSVYCRSCQGATGAVGAEARGDTKEADVCRASDKIANCQGYVSGSSGTVTFPVSTVIHDVSDDNHCDSADRPDSLDDSAIARCSSESNDSGSPRGHANRVEVRTQYAGRISADAGQRRDENELRPPSNAFSTVYSNGPFNSPPLSLPRAYVHARCSEAQLRSMLADLAAAVDARPGANAGVEGP